MEAYDHLKTKAVSCPTKNQYNNFYNTSNGQLKTALVLNFWRYSSKKQKQELEIFSKLKLCKHIKMGVKEED